MKSAAQIVGEDTSVLSVFLRMLSVRLPAANGVRGGNDKRRHVQLIADDMPNIVVKQAKDNVYAGIDYIEVSYSRFMNKRGSIDI